MRSHRLMIAIAVLSGWPAASFAQVGADPRVPLRDGLYFTSPDMCVGFKKGEVDGAAYDVDKGGRLISGPESACVVASIKTIRPNRYLVVTDCREIDEVSRWRAHWLPPSEKLASISLATIRRSRLNIPSARP